MSTKQETINLLAFSSTLSSWTTATPMNRRIIQKIFRRLSLFPRVSFLAVPIRVLVPILVPIYTKNDIDKSVNDIDKSVL